MRPSSCHIRKAQPEAEAQAWRVVRGASLWPWRHWWVYGRATWGCPSCDTRSSLPWARCPVWTLPCGVGWWIDWCCFYYFAMKWSSSYAWNSICLNLFLRFVESVFFHQFFFVFLFFLFFIFCVYVCVKSLIKSFHPSHPGPCARLSLFLLCANCTCVLVCMCLCMCMWKCVGKVINVSQI